MDLRVGHYVEIGLDHERSLTLAEEDVGGGVEGLTRSCSHSHLEDKAICWKKLHNENSIVVLIFFLLISIIYLGLCFTVHLLTASMCRCHV